MKGGGRLQHIYSPFAHSQAADFSYKGGSFHAIKTALLAIISDPAMQEKEQAKPDQRAEIF